MANKTTAADARQKAVIQSQIYQLNTELTDVNSQIYNLVTEKSNLDTYIGQWDTQKAIYNGNETISEVVIVNVFEGVCASRLKSDMRTCIKAMNNTYSEVNGLNSNMETQISTLRQYVLTIKARLKTLKNQLN